jgi:hypothetical protein
MIRTVFVACSLLFAVTASAGEPAGDAAAAGATAKPAVQIDKAHYAVTVTAPAGSPANIEMAPRGGFKINKAYPTKILLKAAAGVTLSKTTLKKADASSLDEKGAAFPVAYTCGDDGGQVEATVKFSVCSEQTCEMVKEKVSWQVANAAATPAKAE